MFASLFVCSRAYADLQLGQFFMYVCSQALLCHYWLVTVTQLFIPLIILGFIVFNQFLIISLLFSLCFLINDPLKKARISVCYFLLVQIFPFILAQMPFSVIRKIAVGAQRVTFLFLLCLSPKVTSDKKSDHLVSDFAAR